MKRTEAQHWATARNWYKARLMGVALVCLPSLHDSKFLLKEELFELLEAYALIQKVLRKWKSRNEKSKQRYLKGDET